MDAVNGSNAVNEVVNGNINPELSARINEAARAMEEVLKERGVVAAVLQFGNGLYLTMDHPAAADWLQNVAEHLATPVNPDRRVHQMEGAMKVTIAANNRREPSAALLVKATNLSPGTFTAVTPTEATVTRRLSDLSHLPDATDVILHGPGRYNPSVSVATLGELRATLKQEYEEAEE